MMFRKPRFCRASSSNSTRTCRRRRRILVDRELADRELLEEALSARAERKVVIERPQRGARRKLLEQAKRNAEEALDRHLAETTTPGQVLRELADTFELGRRSQAHRSL